MRLCTVYGLASSADGKIRYVGQTTQELKSRLSQHLSHAQYVGKTRCDCWIRSVLAAAEEVLVFPIETDAIWHRSEQRLIAFYRKHGAALVNLTDGGEGALGAKFPGRKGTRKDLAARNRRGKGKPGHHGTEEGLRKISKALKGRKAPWVSKRNRTNHPWIGKKHSAETKAKMSASGKGRIFSAEHRAKIAAKARLRGSPSLETRAKMSASHRRRHAKFYP